MSDESDGYHTYLLRVWRARYGGHWQWHASLENPRTGERVTFATLDALSQYLESRSVLPGGKGDAGYGALPPTADY
jgi:hypothetical protein